MLNHFGQMDVKRVTIIELCCKLLTASDFEIIQECFEKYMNSFIWNEIINLFHFIHSFLISIHGIVNWFVYLLRKYNQHIYLDSFIQTGHFQPKRAWKRLVNKQVLSAFKEQWSARVVTDACLRPLTLFVKNPLGPCVIWRTTLRFPLLDSRLESLEMCVLKSFIDFCVLKCNIMR